MNEKQIIDWLREEDEQKLEILWRLADETRIAHVGDQVHLRGLIEVSNICARRCGYCGISADNRQIQRYRMTEEEIMDCVQKGRRLRLWNRCHAGGRRLRHYTAMDGQYHPPDQGRNVYWLLL